MADDPMSTDDDNSSQLAESMSSSTIPNSVDIVSNGDVVFVLNDGTKLRVHSAVLRMSSAPFEAWFGPNFSEGQDLSEKNPKEIALPEDHPAGMIFLCKVLHHKVSATEPLPDLDLLEKFAYLVDKYLCCEAVSVTAFTLLTRWLTAACAAKFQSDEHGRLLGISALLGCSELFTLISKGLMRYHSGSFNTVKITDADNYRLLPDTLVTIAERALAWKIHIRETVSRKIAAFFRELGEGIDGRISHNCFNFSNSMESTGYQVASCASVLSARYSDHYRGPALTDSLEAYFNYYIVDHNGMNFSREWIHHTSEDPGVCRFCSDSLAINELSSLIRNYVSKVKISFRGLCLDCVRDASKEKSKRERGFCNTTHESLPWETVKTPEFSSSPEST
ncbi:hypothetical protein GTA08_BOTSDO05869 [Neofusicoccum parvum]|uniref:Uncharacterized protein n=1 Tax=Neofusicoccum parvum TaxID=310453 RepID=A0ACB5S6E3_9PEZI|nr:hypothetical protein GTA08_BOTSDO05869 [Neofusicoccum parvum]